MSTDHIAAAAKILAANIVNDADVRRASALAVLGAATELRLLRQQSACKAVPMGAPDDGRVSPGEVEALETALSQHRQALLRIEDIVDDPGLTEMQLDAVRRLVKDALGRPPGFPIDFPDDDDDRPAAAEAAHAPADVDGQEGE